MDKLSEQNIPTDKLNTLLPKSVMEQWNKNKQAKSLGEMMPVGSEVLAEALSKALDEVAQLEEANEKLVRLGCKALHELDRLAQGNLDDEFRQEFAQALKTDG